MERDRGRFRDQRFPGIQQLHLQCMCPALHAFQREFGRATNGTLNIWIWISVQQYAQLAAGSQCVGVAAFTETATVPVLSCRVSSCPGRLMTTCGSSALVADCDTSMPQKNTPAKAQRAAHARGDVRCGLMGNPEAYRRPISKPITSPMPADTPMAVQGFSWI